MQNRDYDINVFTQKQKPEEVIPLDKITAVNSFKDEADEPHQFTLFAEGEGQLPIIWKLRALSEVT